MAESDNARIGGAHFEIGADTTPLQAGIKQAESQVAASAAQIKAESEKMAAAIRADADRISIAYSGVGDSTKAASAAISGASRSADQMVSAFSSVVGKATFVIGTLTALVAALGRVASAYLEAGNEAENFIQSISGKPLSDQAKDLEKQLFELRNKYDRSFLVTARNIALNPFRDFNAEREQLESQLEEINRLRGESRSKAEQEEEKEREDKKTKEAKAQQDKADEARKFAESEKERVASIEDDAAIARAGSLAEKESLEAAHAVKISKIQRRILTEANESARTALVHLLEASQEELQKKLHDQQMEFIKKESDARLKGIRDAITEFEKFQSLQNQQQSGFALNDVGALFRGVSRDINNLSRRLSR